MELFAEYFTAFLFRKRLELATNIFATQIPESYFWVITSIEVLFVSYIFDQIWIILSGF